MKFKNRFKINYSILSTPLINIIYITIQTRQAMSSLYENKVLEYNQEKKGDIDEDSNNSRH
jgi:hypothetical protein